MKVCKPASRSWSEPPATKPLASSEQFLFTFVRTALENKLKGNGTAYNKLVQALSNKLDGAAYSRWFSALCRCVSVITAKSDHSKLLQALLSFDWDTTDGAIEEYVALIIDLMTSSAEFLPLCFVALVDKLRLHPVTANEDDNRFVVATADIASKIHDNIHKIFQIVLHLIPLASTVLFPILVDRYPHTRFSSPHHLTYSRNLLRITSYAPEIRERILELIIRKVILLDSEITETDIRPAVAAPVHGLEGASADYPYLLDDDDDELSVVGSEENKSTDLEVSPPPYSTSSSSIPHLIDQMMSMLLTFLSEFRDSYDVCQSLFSALLRIFESAMLTSHNCWHAPYLIFFISSFRNSYAEAFLRYLLERAFDQMQSVHIRVGCARYLGAFLIRANFVRHVTIMNSFETLLRFVHSYVEVHEERMLKDAGSDVDENGMGNEREIHAVFYALAQTMFQLFCQFQKAFQSFFEESPELSDFFRFTTIVESRLNPLRSCPDHIVAEFATVVLSLGLGDCYPVIRRNNMLVPVADLNVIFPFEPLSLIQSKEFFKTIYNCN